MYTDLTTRSAASRRLILVCYANQHREVMPAVAARLKDQRWAPTVDDCPVDWEALQRWYRGLQRTGQLVMDSY